MKKLFASTAPLRKCIDDNSEPKCRNKCMLEMMISTCLYYEKVAQTYRVSEFRFSTWVPRKPYIKDTEVVK